MIQARSLSLWSHLMITRVISQTKSGFAIMWTRLVRSSDHGHWFGKIQGSVIRVHHLVRTNSYVSATVYLVRVMALWFVWRRDNSLRIPTAALQHVPDLLMWAILPGPNIPVWMQVNMYDDNLMIWNTRTTDPGTTCEHNLKSQDMCGWDWFWAMLLIYAICSCMWAPPLWALLCV